MAKLAPKRIALALIESGLCNPTDDEVIAAAKADGEENGYDVKARKGLQVVRSIRRRIDAELAKREKKELRYAKFLDDPQLKSYAPGDGALSFVYHQTRAKDRQQIAVGVEVTLEACEQYAKEHGWAPTYELIVFPGNQIRAVHRVERVDNQRLRTTYPGHLREDWKSEVAEGKTREGYDQWHARTAETYRYVKRGRADYAFFFKRPEFERELQVENLSLKAVLTFYLENEKFLLFLRAHERADPLPDGV